MFIKKCFIIIGLFYFNIVFAGVSSCDVRVHDLVDDNADMFVLDEEYSGILIIDLYCDEEEICETFSSLIIKNCKKAIKDNVYPSEDNNIKEARISLHGCERSDVQQEIRTISNKIVSIDKSIKIAVIE